MQIILAAPRGFCAGVNMAIESLEKAVALYGTPIYVYHEIVHNRWVVEHFKDKGVVFVDNLEEVPENSYLLFSAHGISPQIRRQSEARKLKTIDATCPLVTKVHLEAIRFARNGYTILLIGHSGHDEVIGTMGEAPEAFRLVQTVEDAATIEIESSDQLAYLTQTTLSVTETANITAKLKERFPRIVMPTKEDICYATQNRQEAVRTLSDQADVLLVVGSYNSSNSRRLAELGKARKVPSYLIDGPDDIDLAWFQGSETVLITAGASAPESVVQECVDMLRGRFGGSVELQSVREEQIRFTLPSLPAPQR
ncbi:MAG: 4-hydroxy-3-methylbut-2-enyl diphosphate reductase [Planctomycetota bacterium]